jgi:hypothetical protein
MSFFNHLLSNTSTENANVKSFIDNHYKHIQKVISKYNKSQKENYDLNPDIITKINQINSASKQEKVEFLLSISSTNKIDNELLSLELEHYNQPNTITNIFQTINKFNPIIDELIEDDFIQHTENTPYFTVPSNSTLYVSSIPKSLEDNKCIENHIDSLESYLNRNCSGKFTSFIEEDNKYDIVWLVIKHKH